MPLTLRPTRDPDARPATRLACRLAAGYGRRAREQSAARAGLDHGLRAGLLTEAASRDASLLKLLELSRHRQIETLRSYLRAVDLFADHANRGLW